MNTDAASGLAVRVRGLRKVYGATVAVADVSFDVRGGEIFGLLGPNGSGKTTTTHDRRVSFTVPLATDLAFLDRVAGVEHVRRDGAQVAVVGSGPLLARTAHALVEHGIEPLDLDVATPTLEDAYLAVTAAGVGDGAGDR